MATLGIDVARTLRRNTNTTRTTRTVAKRRVSFTSRKEARIDVVRSSTTPSEIAGGIEARSSGRSSYDPVHRLDHVGAGLAVEHDEHGALAVGDARGAHVLHRFLDVGDVLEADRRALLVGDDHRPVLLGGEELIVGA